MLNTSDFIIELCFTHCVVLGVKGNCQDRDIYIDIEWFNDRIHSPFWKHIGVLHDLVIDFEV